MLDKLKNRIDNWMHPADKYKPDVLYDLMFGRGDVLTPPEEIEKESGIQLSRRPVQVAIVRIADDDCVPEKLDSILRSCRELTDSDEVLPVSDGCNQIVFVFFQDTTWDDQIRDILSDIQNDFRRAYPDSHLYITLGTVENPSDDGEPVWRRSFKIATGLQDYRYIKTKGSIIAYSDIISRRQAYPKGLHFHFDLLKDYLEADDPEHIDGWLAGVFSLLSEDAWGLGYHLTLEIVVNTVSLLHENGLPPEKTIGYPEEIVEKVLSMQSLQELQQWTGAFLSGCRSLLKKTG